MKGSTDQKQFSFFGDGDDKFVPPAPKVQTFEPDPQAMRDRLYGLLEQVTRATQMPWSPRDLRMWKKVFPNMTNWLPADEAIDLKTKFQNELDRLEA